ncbi:DUF2278 family protein [Paraburkholderia diazotrophica]|uniref:Uncharacterized protein YukJ n=1 Tax=Paraburkholderia diazotrophica TaxID=667676 RepID=A0A1H7CNZ6_9BURK|nr:DUF2278 family protein [Paraburkholderia diazotrophica]SEJ90944.1 Uncharacterized protein YukJ [Paraburkholderia diazotrophica]
MSNRFRKATSKYVYGVLVGRITDGQENPHGNSPHYEILVDAAGTPYRIAVNIQSVEGSEVLAFFDQNYSNNTKLDLGSVTVGSHGFNALKDGPGGNGLDYLRDELFPLDKMAPIPPDGSGITLSALLDAQIERAKQDSSSVIVAVGDMFDDSQTTEEVGFALGRGVHDIHMMQGNRGHFAEDNRINGDGALFVRFSGGETIALFVRFLSQETNTDDHGNPKDVSDQ